MSGDVLRLDASCTRILHGRCLLGRAGVPYSVVELGCLVHLFIIGGRLAGCLLVPGVERTKVLLTFGGRDIALLWMFAVLFR